MENQALEHQLLQQQQQLAQLQPLQQQLIFVLPNGGHLKLQKPSSRARTPNQYPWMSMNSNITPIASQVE